MWTSSPNTNPYDAVADTFDYLLRFRHGKTAVLVFANMENRSTDPQASRAAPGRLARSVPQVRRPLRLLLALDVGLP